jgi:hypothetical protein
MTQIIPANDREIKQLATLISKLNDAARNQQLAAEFVQIAFAQFASAHDLPATAILLGADESGVTVKMQETG